MIRFLFILLFSTSVLANDNCTYKTEQVIEDGKVIKVIEHKSCVETEKLNKQNFLVSFALVATLAPSWRQEGPQSAPR